ncbi:MAG TPA: hypothetical protein VKR38_04845 [Usitatibacter sp.]|nr:hypothetical protein [Usitatibacter sp.]
METIAQALATLGRSLLIVLGLVAKRTGVHRGRLVLGGLCAGALSLFTPQYAHAENEIYTLLIGNHLGRDLAEYEVSFENFRSAGVVPKGVTASYDCIDRKWPEVVSVAWKDNLNQRHESKAKIEDLPPTSPNQSRYLVVTFMAEDFVGVRGANITNQPGGVGKCERSPLGVQR